MTAKQALNALRQSAYLAEKAMHRASHTALEAQDDFDEARKAFEEAEAKYREAYISFCTSL